MKQFGVSGDCLEQRLDAEDQRRAEFLAAYPTRLKRFLHWLGWKPVTARDEHR